MSQGITITKACEVVQLCPRRLQRWREQARLGQWHRRKSSTHQHKPYNALTPAETALVNRMIASSEHADASCRVLSVIASEREHVYIFHVAFWQAMKAKGINGPRGVYAKRRQSQSKPDTAWATEPNQLWAWDITYVRTSSRFQHFYLYTVLDCVSRKVVAWHVSDRISSDEAQTVWDKALLSEGLVSNPPTEMPRSLSDRGAQMRSTSTQRFFKALGVDQIFSRPRTPNDNPQVEALFSTVKNFPAYPGRFETIEEARLYFERFFFWYNNEHYHTSLNMIPPAAFHDGRAEEILSQRRIVKEQTMARRRAHYTREAKWK